MNLVCNNISTIALVEKPFAVFNIIFSCFDGSKLN